jgi:endogenous inhibitor of DNA gyrase (YacG/DUF329 family)
LTTSLFCDIIKIQKRKGNDIMRDAIVEIHCPFCGKTHTVEVNEDAYYDWQDGMLIQDAMPDLTPTEREQLISQLCPDCQKMVFGG